MNIKIISVGKLKEKYLQEACKEYTKRLSRYHKLIFIECQDEKAPEKLSLKQELKIKELEGGKILKNIKDSEYVITLDLKGKQLSSEELTQKIESIAIDGKNDISFVIGGSLGLAPNILKRGNFSLCFSKMTFPHQLMKVILLEQIYRSAKISSNEPYHK